MAGDSQQLPRCLIFICNFINVQQKSLAAYILAQYLSSLASAVCNVQSSVRYNNTKFLKVSTCVQCNSLYAFVLLHEAGGFSFMLQSLPTAAQCLYHKEAASPFPFQYCLSSLLSQSTLLFFSHCIEIFMLLLFGFQCLF